MGLPEIKPHITTRVLLYEIAQSTGLIWFVDYSGVARDEGGPSTSLAGDILSPTSLG